MKPGVLTWIVPAILCGALSNAAAQGKVDFRNGGILFATPADRNVYGLDGGGAWEANWCVQLYYRAGASQGVDAQGVLINATEVRGAPVRFRGTPSLFPGRWATQTGTTPYRVLDGISEGQTATLQVRAWDLNLFHSYNEAVGLGGVTGHSVAFNYTVPPTNAPENAFYMEGFRAFQLQPGTPGTDTYVTEHPDLGGPTSTHGLDTNLFANSAAGYLSYPLIRFDLGAASFRGRKVIGQPQFQVAFSARQPPSSFAVHPILVPWDASSVSYDTFGAMPGVQFEADVGPAITATQLPTVDYRISATLPAALVQAWIDNPAVNYGLLVSNLATNLAGAVRFASFESQPKPVLILAFEPKPGPTITIDVSEVRICWKSEPGATHQLQYRSELTANQWVDLGSPLAGDGTTNCVAQPVTTPARFYRVLTTR
ncbi:MAG TPA: DNRLRE domain-containing protein [Verrucomicrobiae bacterium]|nr:DNRLRE domain-containing protein [Verrucomicrobiae bacterium]